MSLLNGDLIGVGIYSVPEAARLTDVAAPRIRRWLRGYSYRRGVTVRRSEPVWRSQLPSIDGEIGVGFLDLIEVRFVDAFLKRGVTWRVIRKAEERARNVFGNAHPFATRRFRTDGRGIFASLLEQDESGTLLDLSENQLAFSKLLSPFLSGVEFQDDIAARWWPMGRKKAVVIDPKRSFGQPIVSREGVPTAVLAKAVEVEQAEEPVARWYEVSLRSVRDAVEFEKKLAA